MYDTTTGNTYVSSEFLMHAPRGPPRRVLINSNFCNFSYVLVVLNHLLEHIETLVLA